MLEYQFNYEAKIVSYQFGNFAYCVFLLPKKLEKKLPFDKYTRLRVTGEYAGQPFENAWQPARGRYFLIVSKKRLKLCGLKCGDKVWLQFDIANQEAVDIPPELEKAIRAKTKLEIAWNKLSAGKKRAFAYRVDSAKRRETRERRVDEVTDLILSGEFFPKNRRW